MRWVEKYFVCCHTPRRELGPRKIRRQGQEGERGESLSENINPFKTGTCRIYKLSGAPCNDCRGDFFEVNSTGNALPLLLVGPQQLRMFCEGWFPISLVRIF